jgi:hypothetical protein
VTFCLSQLGEGMQFSSKVNYAVNHSIEPNKGPQQGIIWPQMSMVLKARSPALIGVLLKLVPLKTGTGLENLLILLLSVLTVLGLNSGSYAC